MVQIAYILLCHKDPDAIADTADRLTAAGDRVAIHFDARAGAEPFRALKARLAANPGVTFAAKRHRCGWGEWSLVAATLEACRAAVAAFPEATHFYMLSGDCAPIKTAEYIRAFLAARDRDFIESFDYFDSDWIKTGFREERLIYRHYFNERSQKWRFYTAYNLQKRLGWTREVPADIDVMIGSQWWCLRRATLEAVLAFCEDRRDVVRFFSTTWIPDETFFQTVVRHLVPGDEIESRTLTFLMFSDYGMPVTFYDDQFALLTSQDFLFARKISPEAAQLKARLGTLYGETGVDFAISNEGRRLFQFLTGRGRTGRRFAPRFWETEASLGHTRELMIVTCKKWHVAKCLVARIKQETRLPAIEFLFDEEATPLPDLGGIQTTLEKRARHRRALMRMLFDYYEVDRLVVCMDTSALSLMEDFASDRATVRVLEVECDFTDAYLVGHAQRVGLAAPESPGEVIDRVLPTIRHDVAYEHERIRDAGFANHTRLREGGDLAENAAALALFLSCAPETALEIARTDHLFAD
ncbi:MAG: DUF5928 domain-containing protein [Shimia sp.]